MAFATYQVSTEEAPDGVREAIRHRRVVEDFKSSEDLIDSYLSQKEDFLRRDYEARKKLLKSISTGKEYALYHNLGPVNHMRALAVWAVALAIFAVSVSVFTFLLR